MSSFPSGISSMKLKVSTFEQDISSASLGSNSIQINEEIKNAFNNNIDGTIFNPSIAVTYSDTAFPSVSEILTPTVIPNYVPKKITPSLSLADIPDKLTTDASFSIASLVSNTGTGVLSYSSSNASVAIVNSSTGQVTIVGAGTATITVSLAASVDQVYAAATPVSKTLTVKITPSLSLADIPDKLTTDTPFSIASLVSNTGTGVLSYSSSNASIATVNSSTGVVTVVGAGTATITVSLAASVDQVYAAATPVSKTLTVNKAIPQLSLSSTTLTKLTTDAPFSIASLVSNTGTGVLYYSSSNTSIATVTGGVVTINGAGTTTITVSLPPSLDGKWAAATPVSVSLTVSLPEPTWTQRGSDIDGEAADDNSGWSVSLSADGSIVAIGAPYNVGNGSVRVYAWNGSSWVQRGADIDGEAADDSSGHNVSLSADGSIVAIGALYNVGNGSNSGHVRVYQYNATKTTAQMNQSLPNFGPIGWNRLGNDIDGEATNDYSGYHVSLSADGSIVAIGAIGNANFRGHVRVYAWNSSSSIWNKRGADIDGEATNDSSGYSVSLSADGSIVAIGTPYNDGNGSNSGHVRVYAWNVGSSSWVQRGSDIDGEAASDYSGWSVSISADGSIVAIGAPYNYGNGSNSGHVRVYAWNVGSSSWVQLGADIDGEAADDSSGRSVSLSADGSIVAICAPNNNGNGSSSGHVRVYAWNVGSSSWVQRGSDIDGEAVNDYSISVSLSADGSIVAIGAPYNDGNGSNSGHVRVYKYE